MTDLCVVDIDACIASLKLSRFHYPSACKSLAPEEESRGADPRLEQIQDMREFLRKWNQRLQLTGKARVKYFAVMNMLEQLKKLLICGVVGEEMAEKNFIIRKGGVLVLKTQAG